MKIKISEDAASMFLGLLVVAAVAVVLVNYFQKRRGNVSVPGVSNELSLVGSEPIEEGSKAAVGEESYTVVRGDSLWKIAVAKYGDGYRWVEIAGGNGIVDPDILAVGQVLKLKPLDQEIVDYQVKSGDSLWKIAVAKYGDGYRWVEIAGENGIVDPDILAVGQVLKLKPLDQEIVDYQVKSGDSLWKIAVAKYGDGYRWVEIWNLNRGQIINPSMIETGMVLRMVK